MNGIKGYISIREASYRWGVSERRVNQYTASPDVFPVHPGSGTHVRSRRMRKSRLIRVRRIPIE